MSYSSEFTISTVSRHGSKWEESELAAFAAAVIGADLQMYVKEAFYDSNSNCCTFDFRFEIKHYDDVAIRLYAIAFLTIRQFDWFGSICHGRGMSDD